MSYDVDQTFSYQFYVQMPINLEAMLHITVEVTDFCKQLEAYYHTARKDEVLSYDVKIRFISFMRKSTSVTIF